MIARDTLDLSRPRRIHLLGIGGAGVGSLARLLAARGHPVTGADAHESPKVAGLRRAGVEVWTGAGADALPPDAEAVIHSAAVPPQSAALRRARERGLAVLKYARALGLLTAPRRTLAVSGTHGKTTTAALLAWTLRSAGVDAGFLVGGEVPQLGGGAHPGRSPDFVVEACEYDRSFLHLSPAIAIVTNVEADHLDYYRDLVEIREAFRAFAARVSELLILHEDLRDSIGRAGGIRARVVTYGEDANAQVRLA
ncbi:MAG: Mur ligase domain-containing protein, partial [Planctomycetota bacterium]